MTATDIAFIWFIIVEALFFVLHCKFTSERPMLDLLCVVVMVGIFIGFIHLVSSFSL